MLWLDNKFDGRLHLFRDHYIREFRHAADDNAILVEIAGCQDQGLHSLVDRGRADGLHFSPVVLANDTCNGSGNGGCS
jgi:hypothetical protein